MERPAKCQCLTSSPSSNAPSDRSQSAGASFSSPSEASPASNNKDTTNTTANNVPPCNKGPTQGKEADDHAQNMVSTDGQEMEYDECDPADTAPSPCPDWNRGTAYHFDKLSGVIKHLVSATFCSKGLWAHYKYLGRPYLELKMRTWMRWQMGTDAVEKNWVPLRRTVKECLQYRRQLCCEWMHEAWVGN
jgi:hypothetical protein